MAEESLTLHETFELHQVLNFKTICMVKSKLMEGLVFNQDLKALLEKDVVQSMAAVSELQSLYSPKTQIRSGDVTQ
ncbi:MAG TPA: spore coat protein [Desulfosporosinus sp.]|nr:spore coat protein [Desulfosporosinus sp.]